MSEDLKKNNLDIDEKTTVELTEEELEQIAGGFGGLDILDLPPEEKPSFLTGIRDYSSFL